MAKKRQSRFIHHNKPASTTHPSLSRSTESKSQPSTISTRTPSTVNERLELLRRSQVAAQDTDVPLILGQITVSLSKTDLDSDRLPNANRPNITPRRPPGPPAPPSWLVAETSTQTPTEDPETLETAYRSMAERLDHLPGIRVPPSGSLLHMTLKSLAKNWGWHLHYNQYYLATLPGDLKSQLLSYISVYGSEGGVNIDGLRTIFASGLEVPGATPSEDVTRLDLSYSITRSISLKQLQRYLSRSRNASATSSAEDDSWEACVDKLPASLSTTPFPYLTHLSLSHPGRNATWSGLLSLAPSLSTLTHLSLARWPVPTLTSPFKFRTTSKLQGRTPSSQLHLVTGNPGFQYNSTAISLPEAADVLRRLSKATYCLKWLDLEDCHDWLKALVYDRGEHGPDWTGAWRRLETIILRQAYNLSTLLDHDEKRRMTARLHWALNYQVEIRVSAEINMTRRDAALPYLHFVCSGERSFEDAPKELFEDLENPALRRNGEPLPGLNWTGFY